MVSNFSGDTDEFSPSYSRDPILSFSSQVGKKQSKSLNIESWVFGTSFFCAREGVKMLPAPQFLGPIVQLKFTTERKP